MVIVTVLAASCLLALAPSPLLAADPVRIVLGGSGATPWEITGIVPGMSGTEVITVRNAGTSSGNLTIWISDIVNTEGTPESIQPDAGAEGDLGDYLSFEIESARLSSNITMPVLITGLPQDVADSGYVRVPSLAAGEMVTLNWNWSLPSDTGNPAQGDSLSFTINYLLEEIPTVRPPRPTARPTEGYMRPEPYVPPTAPETESGSVAGVDTVPQPPEEPLPTPTPTATTTAPPTTPPDYEAEGLPWYYWLLVAFAGGVGFMLLFLGRRRRKQDEEH